MFCTQCGTKLEETARYCTSCGKPVDAPPPSTPFQEAPGQTPRKLHRIVAGKKIAGVCTGFAEYFDMDLTLMRLIWVVLTIIPPHIGLIAYIVSWAVLPKE